MEKKLKLDRTLLDSMKSQAVDDFTTAVKEYFPSMNESDILLAREFFTNGYEWGCNNMYRYISSNIKIIDN